MRLKGCKLGVFMRRQSLQILVVHDKFNHLNIHFPDSHIIKISSLFSTQTIDFLWTSKVEAIKTIDGWCYISCPKCSKKTAASDMILQLHNMLWHHRCWCHQITLSLLHSCSVKLLSSDVIGLTICPPLKMFMSSW